MARWELVPAFDRQEGVPLFQQIARRSRTRSAQRLRPGERLPGTRTLARALGLQRLTVVSAMEELAAEGWVEIRPALRSRRTAWAERWDSKALRDSPLLLRTAGRCGGRRARNVPAPFTGKGSTYFRKE